MRKNPPEDEFILEKLSALGIKPGMSVTSSQLRDQDMNLVALLGVKGKFMKKDPEVETNPNNSNIETALGHLGIEYSGYVKNPDAKLDAIIEETYPREKVEQALAGELNLMTPTEFLATHISAYSSGTYNKGTVGKDRLSFPKRVEKLHQDLFKDTPWHNLYEYIASRITPHRDRVRKELLHAFFSGKNISRSARHGSFEDKLLHRKVHALNRRDAMSRIDRYHRPHKILVEDLTGIPERYVNSLDSTKINAIGLMGELYMQALLKTAQTFGSQELKRDISNIFTGTEDAISQASNGRDAFEGESFRIPSEESPETRFSDGRLGNTAIEVKVGYQDWVEVFKKLWADYKSNEHALERKWLSDNSSVDQVVLLALNKTAQEESSFFTDAGFNFVNPELFREVFMETLTEADKYKEFQELDLGLLVRSYDTLVESPHLFLRVGNNLNLGWLNNSLKNYVFALNSFGPLQHTSLSVLDHPQKHEHEIRTYTLDSLEVNSIGKELAEKSLDKKVVFVDVECSQPIGMSFNRYESLPFITGIAQYDGQWNFSIYFAPTPEAERSMLEEISHLIGQADELVTYNGKRYDMPVLSSRMWTHNIPFDIPHHTDLLDDARKTFTLPDYKLQTIEQIIFEHKRVDDIPGNQIPRIYRRWLERGDNKEKIEKVIHHNAQDIATTAATYFRTR